VPFNSSVISVIIPMRNSSESFDNINRTEHSTVKIMLLPFDANCMQSTYVNITSTANK